MAEELKRGAILTFEDGLLTIKVAGYGRANGWGELAFPERQVDIDADGYHKVEIPPSELLELRDFITRVLGAPSEECTQISDERIEIDRLARAFGVSPEKAEQAQDDLGFLYRKLA